ncbi:metallophosphoesterase [Heyndrickxia camelliae]|uniref:Metallophosphoesterase n=1 Tax=Heyndrickxia camelliae TaxID=1707093 RepID=A0A2N3LMY2_9BACI|nr:metallophosphoesterase [Heyndrickxia camelliae]PKR85935.1 metallophosphoesterase [Heyndrickxia camelliae]
MVQILVILILILLLIFYMFKEASLNQVLHQTITFPDYPAGFKDMKIFFISDIHRRKVQEAMISNLEKQADLVIIGGDLLEKGVPVSRVEYNLQLLKRIGPLFFVWGNNDYEVEESKLLKILKEYQVRVLRNESVIFRAPNGDSIAILGIDDLSQENDRLDLALHGTEFADFKLLISHNPDIIAKMSEEDNISFVMSGHTHGGQIQVLGFTPYRKGGIYKSAVTTLFVSNGYGTSMLPLRLGAKPEAHFITIKKE